jgi:flagellar basal-body rod protein FlgG
MNQGVYSLAASMVNQLNRVDVLSNNLANANTIGFKQDNLVEGSFNYFLEKNSENSEKLTKYNVISNIVPKIDGDYVNTDLGSIVTTANALDFSLKHRDTFFKVNNNNEILLTRDGAFKNINGFLSTSEGFNVLDQTNAPIAVEDGFETLICIVKTSYKNLQKQGDNNFLIKNTKNTKTIQNNNEFILQGSLETSNINTITTMVSLIDSQRRLEQAQKASNGIDEINQKLIDKLTR